MDWEIVKRLFYNRVVYGGRGSEWQTGDAVRFYTLINEHFDVQAVWKAIWKSAWSIMEVVKIRRKFI